MQMSDPQAEAGALTLVNVCAGLKQGERALIIANEETRDVAEIVRAIASEVSSDVEIIVEPTAQMHGSEPSARTAAKMLKADVIFCLTLKSLAHSQARLKATESGARYLSLADYSMDQLRSPALTFDFACLLSEVERLGSKLDAGKRVRVTSAGGTELQILVEGRKANRAPGVVTSGGLGSPPDAEVNIAPIETFSNGRIVVDGSIPCNEIGLLEEPVVLVVEDGSIVDMEGHAPAVAALQRLFEEAGPKSRVLAEFGIGLNPLAELCGRMLEDEGCGGTIHFGFGSNATIGGANRVGFHLDFIVRSPRVYIDDVELQLADSV